MPDYVPPSINTNVLTVAVFEELLTTPFTDGINALCWQRELPGDFDGVMKRLNMDGGITPLDEDFLENETWNPGCREAIDFMLGDLHLLREHGLMPELNGITGYERDEDTGLLRTDVYSFHVDSATDEADTWLCTYLGASSEGLGNEEALRLVDDTEIRANLLKDFGGADDGDFLAYLADHCYDLHFAPKPGARPFSFGLGNLWRIAVDYPGSSVLPCIHRAPDSLPGSPPRLLLIA